MKKKGTLIKTYKGTRITANDAKYDTLMMVYRDENGIKQTIGYDRPTMDYFVLKDKESQEAINPPMYIESDKVQKYSSHSDMLFREIAIHTSALSFYDRVRASKGSNAYDMKNLFKSPLLYGADMDLEDQYIAKFYENFESDANYKLHKSYFDIETDLMPNGDPREFIGFPDPKIAPMPIALNTLFDEKTMTAHTFVLRNVKNKLLVKFEAEEIEEFKKDVITKVKEADDIEINIELYFHDTEKELIEHFFNMLHDIDPDFCGSWNSEFDIQTIQNRLLGILKKDKELKEKGLNPFNETNSIISDLKYSHIKTDNGADLYNVPKAYYQANIKQKIGERFDRFTVLDGIYWIDQMWNYGCIHVPEGKLDSYSLDNVSNVKLGKEKLPFAPGETIKNLLWINTKKFIEYNIRDVLLLFLLEDKTKDIELLQRLSEITNTRKEKVYSKSISLTNFVNKYVKDQGLVMRTNKNISYGDNGYFYEKNFLPDSEINEFDPNYIEVFNKKDRFGAIVADPELNEKEGIEIIKGKPSKYVYKNVCDQDFSSLYPSILRAWNLDSLHIIGKFYCIDGQTKSKIKSQFGYKNMFNLSKKDDDNINEEVDDDSDDLIDDLSDDNTGLETNDLGPVISDAIMSQQWSRVGELFFNLPSTEKLINKIKKQIKE